MISYLCYFLQFGSLNVTTDSCFKVAKLHAAAGADELSLMMATETIPHDKVMSSIELLGKHVIPRLRKSARRGRSHLLHP